MTIATSCFPCGHFDKKVSQSELDDVEKELDCEFPEELAALYLEVGAIYDDTSAAIVQGIDYTVDDCKDFWGTNNEDIFMDMNSMFPFGGDGGGDRFFIRISGSGLYLRGVYSWNHENDSRTWHANNIKDLLMRLSVDSMENSI